MRVRHQSTCLGNVLGSLHEGQGDPVEAELDTETEIRVVLPGQGGDRQHSVGDVDTFAVGQDPTDHDRRLGEIGPAAVDAQLDPAIVEQQVLTGLQNRENLRVR